MVAPAAAKLTARMRLRHDTRLQESVTQELRVLRGLPAHPFVGVLLFVSVTRAFVVLGQTLGAQGDLMRLLQQRQRLPEAEAEVCLREVASALEFLHGQQLVYRDVSLTNTLLTTAGHVLLADFGASRFLRRPGERALSIVGSVDFVSPDMLLGEGYGCETDLWAFGVLAYELLCGRPPFWCSPPNQHAIFDLIMTIEPELPDHLSAAAQALLCGLLEKDAAARFTWPAVRETAFFSDRNLEWDPAVLAARPSPLSAAAQLPDAQDEDKDADETGLLEALGDLVTCAGEQDEPPEETTIAAASTDTLLARDTPDDWLAAVLTELQLEPTLVEILARPS